MSTRLRAPVRDALREPYDEAAIEAGIARVRAARRSPVRSRRWMAAGGGLAAAAAIALAVMFAGEESGPLREGDRPLAGVLRGPREVALDDGSRLVLAAGARLEVLENERRDLHLLLASGEVVFDVRPGGDRQWTIECGLATVRVLGTRFTIERDGERVRVAVSRGAVLVSGEHVPDRARRLGAGQSLEVRVPVAPVADPVVVPTAPAPPRSPAAPPLRSRAPSAPRVVSVADLLAQADAARLSGRPREAVAPLERILAEHAGHPDAALAAFTLGRIEADALRRPERATRAFERAIELGLPPALERDASARLVRLREATGAPP